MRIGVVAYELEGERSGVGRYLEGLLSGLCRLGRTDPDSSEWLLFMQGEPFEHPLFEQAGIVPVFDGRPGGSAILWEQLRLPKLLRGAELDALVSPGYSLPPGVDVPRMVTLHDLSFEHLGGEFALKERWRRRFLGRLAARRGDRVLADTEAIARDLRDTYGLPEHKVGVVPLAVDERFFAAASGDDPGGGDPGGDDSALTELGITGPYLLHLGTLLPRRRLDLVLDAFDAVADRFPDLRLVLAGRNQLPDPEELDRRLAAGGREERVLRLSYVPEERLPALYAGAEATLYLSTYEGYGLPPLESIAAGTPALASRGLALDDLAPTYPWRTELHLPSVVALLERMLVHPNPRESIAETRRAIRELTWETCAERYLAELRIAMAKPGTVAEPGDEP